MEHSEKDHNQSEIHEYNLNLTKTFLVKIRFQLFLKQSMEDAFLMSRGSLFHSVGAAKVNERSPYDFNLKIGAFLKRCWNFALAG